jgi:hypothetical protein
MELRMRMIHCQRGARGRLVVDQHDALSPCDYNACGSGGRASSAYFGSISGPTCGEMRPAGGVL